jgi:predicted N-acyltransferase
MAYGHDGPVAGTLNFEKGRHLYGRYWGAEEHHDALHFELCLYRLIERAIERGHERFEAGAQGIHKLRRGLMPSEIHSVHWIRNPVLSQAVADFLPREASAVERQMRELSKHGPFHRG